MATNVPKIAFTATGIEVPEQAALLAGAKADINDAFGGGLNMADKTAQGQLAASLAAIVADKNAEIAEIVNGINPDVASGRFQDGIARIYFLERSPGAPTVAQCVCTGELGVTIPAGTLAQDTSGNRYRSTQSGTIGVSGTITIPFANEVDGPIPCPAGTLTKIYQAIPNWDDITNPTDGALGQNVESQEAFAYRRQQSVALNARDSLSSIYANVFDQPDVLDVYAYENITDAPIQVGATAYVLAPHSLYVAALGGSADDIARAIWTKKSLGCNYNGNTTVTITDESGYDAPYPTYPVTFQRPTPLPILFQVNIQQDPNLPADIVQLTKRAVVAAFNGQLPRSTRVRIGSQLVASRFYQHVQGVAPGMSVLLIQVGTAAPNQNAILIGIDRNPTVSEADVTVTLVP